jgi:2OG-Fe(II) oxygenase superfamily
MNKRQPYIKESFLNREECAILIKLIQCYAKNDPRFPARISTKKRTVVPVRLISKHGLIPEADLLEQIKKRCQTEIEANFALKHQIYPGFMMLQGNYHGDGHIRHADNRRYDEISRSWMPNHTPQWVVTAGIYLNHCGVDFMGGELIFPVLNITIPARPGLFVAYPSDERFEHEVPPVQSGARYSILLWFKDSSRSEKSPLNK